MDERALAERLITYDTSTPDGLRAARRVRQGLARGARDRRPRHTITTACRCSLADGRAARRARRDRLHGHLDVVPGHQEQFTPRVEGDRLYRPRRLRHEGRARGDDVRACTTSPRRTRVRVRFVCVPDEESEDIDDRSTDALVRERLHRRLRDHRRADRPARRRPGQGRARDAASRSRGRAAHGSTPWLGDNAVLKAHRRLPPNRVAAVLARVLRAVRPPVDQPRRGSTGGDALNKVPDRCAMDVDIRYLPDQDPGEILAQIRAIPTSRSCARSSARPRSCRARNPYVLRAARRRRRARSSGESLSVGRDGASDAVSFLEAGVPAVEFGPAGGGHHGPEEWVSIASLARYRQRARRLRRTGLPAQLARAARRRRRCARSRAGSAVSATAYGAEAVAPRRRAPALRAFHACARLDLRPDRASRRPRRVGDRRAAAGRRRRLDVARGTARAASQIEHPGADHSTRRRRRAADDPDPRLRPAATRTRKTGRRAALGHDHARPPRPGQARDGGDVDPARPQGRHPRPRHRQDQRRLRARRPAPDAQDGQEAVSTRAAVQDQPRRQRQLRRLPARGQLRSAASTSTSTAATTTTTRAARRELRDDRHPARLPEALRQDALDYVRYRHSDNDLVRAARQQDFLRQAKDQVGASKLDPRRPQGAREHLRALHATPTRACDEDAILLAAQARALLRQEPGPRGPVPGVDVDPTARYLDVVAGHAAARPSSAVPEPRRRSTGARAGSSDQPQGGRRRARSKRKNAAPGTCPASTDARTQGEDQAIAGRRASCASRSTSRRCGSPAAATLRRDTSRARLHDPRPRASKRTTPTGSCSRRASVGEYYGIQGTTWKAPADPRRPARDAAQSAAASYELYYDGDRLRLVAWQTPRGVYWVSNTLSQTLTQRADARDRRLADARRRASSRRPASAAPRPMSCRREPIGVIGTGYVGLVTAAGFAELG